MPRAGSGGSSSSDGSPTASYDQQQQQQQARPRYPPFTQHVHGVLYKLRAADMATIARKEAGYVIKEIEVGRWGGLREGAAPACGSWGARTTACVHDWYRLCWLRQLVAAGAPGGRRACMTGTGFAGCASLWQLGRPDDGVRA
jgi:hypothetical protein